MAFFVVTVRPYEGRYEFDGAAFTTREWGWIKKLGGYLPLTYEGGLRDGDPELITVVALIAMRRCGRIDAAQVTEVFERFQDVDFDGEKISYEGDPAEDDAGPPPRSSNGNDSFSGGDSATSTATPEPTREATGPPPSATSASALLTSAT